MTNVDLRSVLPSSVTVVFPRSDSGVVGTSVYAHIVTLVSLAIPEFAGFTGHAGSHTIRSKVIAEFTSGGSPDNLTELEALSEAIASDFYRYQAAPVDLRLIGTPPWEPSGLDDHFEITYQLDNLSTRIQRPAWNEIVEELPIARCCPCPQYVAEDWSVDQDDYPLPPFAELIKANVTAPMSLTGIIPPFPDKACRVTVENRPSSIDTLSIPHLSVASASGNRIHTDTEATVEIDPGQSVQLQYDPLDEVWVMVGKALGEAAGTGTVTSVDITVPSPLTVTGNPITTSGTFAVTWTGLAPGDLLYALDSDTIDLLPIGTEGQVLTVVSGFPEWVNAGAGSGTVTSVDLTVPSFLTVTGGPITTNGTFAVTWTGMTTNGVWYADSPTSVDQIANAIQARPQYLQQTAEGVPLWEDVGQIYTVREVFTLSGTQHDLVIDHDTSELFFDSNTPLILTGIVPNQEMFPASGKTTQVLWISVKRDSVGGVTLKHNDVGSSIGNRFETPHEIDYVLEPGQSVMLLQSVDSSGSTPAWHLVVGNEGVWGVDFVPPSLMAVAGVPDTGFVTITLTWNGLTAGDLIYATGSTTTDNLSIGDEDDVLTVVSGLPAWAPVPPRVASGASGGLASTPQTIPTGTPTDLEWGAGYDTDSYFGMDAERITVPRDGFYLIVAQIRWSNADDPTSGLCRVRIFQRTATPSDVAIADQWFQFDPAQGISPSMNLSILARANAGDWFAVVVSHNQGADRDIGDAFGPTSVTIHLLDEDP